MTLLGVTEVVVELKRSLLDHGVPICQVPQPGTPHQHGVQVRPGTVNLRTPSGDAGMKTHGISLRSGTGKGASSGSVTAHWPLGAGEEPGWGWNQP